MDRLLQFSALCATLMILSGCSTVNDMVTSNIPEVIPAGHLSRELTGAGSLSLPRRA